MSVVWMSVRFGAFTKNSPMSASEADSITLCMMTEAV